MSCEQHPQPAPATAAPTRPTQPATRTTRPQPATRPQRPAALTDAVRAQLARYAVFEAVNEYYDRVQRGDDLGPTLTATEVHRRLAHLEGGEQAGEQPPRRRLHDPRRGG